MKDRLWNSLIASLRSGQCVLVLGPDLPVAPEAAGAGADAPPMSVRDLFCEDLARQLTEEEQTVPELLLFAVAQQYADFEEFSTVNLKNYAAAFFRDSGRRPGSQHGTLARLPFSTILTTCHDDLFAKALSDNGKTPSRYWYHYMGEPRDNRELAAPPEPQTPALYHLLGTFDEPNSLVLTENDLLDFTIHVISGRPKLPDSLRSALRNKTFLFFGYGIKHWYIRVLLKLLIRWLELSGGSVALESLGGLGARERDETVLFYKRGTRIEVVDMEAGQFLDDLSQRFERAGGYLGPTRTLLRRPQVFISYERSDTEVARRLYDTLPKDKLEPCLDSQLLGAGEDWNSELEQKIRSSDYFLVLNSMNLVDKQVGYVNKELALAFDLQKYRQQGVNFIIPLQVGGLRAGEGRADLQPFHQLPLRAESFFDDVAEITRQIGRDFQVRMRQ